MKPRVSLLLAALVLAGCAAPEPEQTDEKPDAVPSPARTGTPSATPSSVALPQPLPSRPRVGRPFTATILADGTSITARVTLTAIDTYRGRQLPELDGTPLLFRWKATNIDHHPLRAANDPVSHRFIGLDGQQRRTTAHGYASGGAVSPAGCTMLPEKVTWEPGQTLRGCSVQTLLEGTRLDRAAFLSGDVRNPQIAEFRLR